MKRIIFLILLLSNYSFSQEVEKVSRRTKHSLTVYYVLKSDMKTKHGKYTVTSNNIVRGNDGKATMVEGSYNFGKKEGYWSTRYFVSRGNLQSQGNYKNDLPIGVWKFYDFYGKLVQEYDFDKNKLKMSNECGSEKEYEAYIDGKFMTAILDCPPSFIGGYQFFVFDMNQKIRTSFKFNKNKDGGSIKIDSQVSFFLNDDGTINNFKFRHSIKNEKLKEFIKNLLLDNKDKFIVAELNGFKVSAKMKLPIQIDIRY